MKDTKKQVIIFIFSYSWKKPQIPNELKDEDKLALAEQLKNFTNDRYITLFSIPFENVKANNAVIISEVNKLHTRLINAKPIKESPLIDIYNEMIKSDVISKDRENFILKDVFYYNVNDFKMELVN